jgi:hypothetical protein
MRLAPDHHMIQTLAPDRSGQPLGKAILVGRAWCRRLVPDAHGVQSARDDAAIDPVAIADEVVRSLIPRKGLRQLACNPFSGRVGCDADPDQLSAVQPNDDEGIEQGRSQWSGPRTGPWRLYLEHDYAERCALPGWAARVA